MNAHTKNAVEKPWRRVLLVRAGFGAAIAGMILGSAIAVYGASLQSGPIFMAGWLCAFPSIGFVVLSGLSCSVLYFDYSMLGRFIPAEAPANWRPVAGASSGVAIGNDFRGSFPTLHCEFGPGGIRLRVLFYPAVFVASTQITSIANDSWGFCVIEHTSQEIRGPIRVMNHVVREMERCMPELSLVRS